MPPPTPMIGKIDNTAASPTEIKGLPFVVCDLKDFAFEGIRYQVISFDAMYIRKGGDPIRESVQGQALPARIMAALNSSKNGDMLVISNIKANAIGTKIGITSIKSAITLTIK